jgi:dihydropteroate synthase
MNNSQFQAWLNKPSNTLIMGILNVTQDSFSDGGKFDTPEQATAHGIKMIEDGADIIDIGGESTRPGAEPVLLEEELNRTIPVIEAIRKQSDCVISIDTYKSKVASAALDAGANLVNDISGLTFDEGIAPLVAEKNVPVILMHIKGTPRDMQKEPHYEDIMGEIKDFREGPIKTVYPMAQMCFNSRINSKLSYNRFPNTIPGSRMILKS